MSSPGESLNDFGLLIAFVIPGLTCLYATSYLIPGLQVWFDLNSLNNMSFGSIVLLAMLSIAAGLIVGTVRWWLLDTLHHLTGVKPLNWDFTRFAANLSAYETLTENHYRYYQFYGGMVVSLTWTLATRSIAMDSWINGMNLAIMVLIALMSWGSRDTLTRYYARLNTILTQASTST